VGQTSLERVVLPYNASLTPFS